MNTRKEIHFFGSSITDSEPLIQDESWLYFGKFDNKAGKYILTGGGTPNSAKIIDISNKPFAHLSGFDKELYCGEWSNNNSIFALSGDGGSIRLFGNSF